MRRRVTLRILIVIIGVTILGTLGLVGVLRSHWGRERVRSELERRLSDSFGAQVQVREVALPSRGRVVLKDVYIKEPAGTTLEVPEAEIELDTRALWALTRRELRISRIVLSQPVVRVPPGGLARPRREVRAKTWTVTIPRVIVTSGTLHIQPDITLSGLNIAAHISGAFDITVAGSGRWVEEDLPVSARGTTRIRGEFFAARDSELTVGASRAYVPLLVAHRSVLAGLVSIRVAEELVPGWQHSLKGAVVAFRDGAVALLRGQLPRLAADLAILMRVRGQPLVFKASRPDLSNGEAAIFAKGAVRGVELARAHATIRAIPGALRAFMNAETNLGWASASMSLTLARSQARLDIARATLHLRLGKGSADGELSARGQFHDLSIEGKADFRRITLKNIHIRSGRTAFSLRGNFERATGKADVNLMNVSVGTFSLQGLDASVNASLKEGRQLQVRLDPLLFSTGDLAWHGAVTFSQRNHEVLVSANLGSTAGQVVAESAPGGRSIRFLFRNIDLAKLRSQLAISTLPARGIASIDATIAPRHLEAHSHIRDLVLVPGATASTFAGAITAARGRFEGHGTLAAKQGGSLAIRLHGIAPTRMFSVPSWRHWARRGFAIVHGAEVVPDRLHLAAIGGGALGTLDGELVLSEGRLVADLDLDDVRGIHGISTNVRGTWGRRALEASVRLEQEGAPLAQGTVELRHELPQRARDLVGILAAPIHGQAVVRALDLRHLHTVGVLSEPVAGIMEGTMSIQGSLKRPIFSWGGHAIDVHFRGAGFRRVSSDGILDRALLVGNLRGIESRGHGALACEFRVPFARDAPLTVSLDARTLDLSFLSSLARGVVADARGLLSASVHVTGTRAAPRIEGRLRLEHGRVAWEGAPHPIRDLIVDANFDGANVLINSVTGRMGTGRIWLEGRILLDEARRSWFTLRARSAPILIGRSAATVDLGMRIRAHRDRTWNLDADLEYGTVKMPRQYSQLFPLGPLSDVTFVGEEVKPTLGRMPSLAFRLDANAGIKVEGAGLDGFVRGTVSGQVSDHELSLVGEAHAVGGSIELFGRWYDVRYARAWFARGDELVPYVEVELVHEFGAATVFVNVSGRASSPSFTLRSDPPVFDQTELLAFVLGGNPDDPALAERPTEKRPLGLVTTLLLSKVRSQLREALPIDVLRVEVGERGGFSTTRLELGKWIAKNLLLGYRFRSGADQEQNASEATLEYRFHTRWLIEAFLGDRGIGAADLLWTKRY